MKPQLASTFLFPLSVCAINIVSGNDDGWATANIRDLYSSLTNAGHSVVISAPALDQSGAGKKERKKG